MLWDSIFEFFVKHVFGGHINNQVYATTLGNVFYQNWGNGSLTDAKAFTMTTMSGGSFSLSYGNYFSMIATFISITLIVILCCLFIYRLIRLVGRLFSGGTL